MDNKYSRGLKRQRVYDIYEPSTGPIRKKVKPSEKIVVAKSPSVSYNYPILSGSPSGLYNMSLSGREYKFIDTDLGNGFTTGAYNSLQLADVAPFTLLNGLALGTGATNRIGCKIAMKSIYYSINIGMKWTDADATANTSAVPCRFMILYDKQSNGVAPAYTDVLSAFVGLNNTTPRAIDTNSPNNLNNRDRFIVITDKRFVISNNGTGGRNFKKYKRLNTSVTYKSGSTTGNISDITSGSLYLYAFCDRDFNAVSDTESRMYISGDIRLRFTDE